MFQAGLFHKAGKLFQHAEGSPICEDQPLTKNECWWGVETKKCRKTGYNDSSCLGRQKEGGAAIIQIQLITRDRMEAEGQTSWKGQPRRYLQAGEYGGKFLGSLRRALCALMSEHHLRACSLRGLHAATARGCSGGCIASSACPGNRGKVINYGNNLSFCQ